MEELWIIEVRDLNIPELEEVIHEMLEADATGYRVCLTDYYRMLIRAISLYTLNNLPKYIYEVLKDEYGDDESIIRALDEQLLRNVEIGRNGARGEAEMTIKGDKLYKLRIAVDIPMKLLHDKYVEFFENYVCGDEIEWCYCREEGEILDHEIFLTKEELRRYRQMCESTCANFVPY